MRKIIITLLVITATFLALTTLLYGQKLEASIDRDGIAKRCPPSSPIAIRIKNRSLSTIKKTYFHLALFRKKISKNLLKTPNHVVEHIIEPFDTQTFCFSDDYMDKFKETLSHHTKNSKKETIVSKAISETKALTKLVSSHSIYVSDIKYKFL